MCENERLMETLGASNDHEFARRLIQAAGVAAVPGSSFYSEPQKGFKQLRFCFSESAQLSERCGHVSKNSPSDFPDRSFLPRERRLNLLTTTPLVESPSVTVYRCSGSAKKPHFMAPTARLSQPAISSAPPTGVRGPNHLVPVRQYR